MTNRLQTRKSFFGRADPDQAINSLVPHLGDAQARFGWLPRRSTESGEGIKQGIAAGGGVANEGNFHVEITPYCLSLRNRVAVPIFSDAALTTPTLSPVNCILPPGAGRAAMSFRRRSTRCMRNGDRALTLCQRRPINSLILS